MTGGAPWSPVQPRPGPEEELLRAVRPVLGPLCAALSSGQSPTRSFTLVPPRPGAAPAEARVQASFRGKVPFRAREAVGYRLAGALEARGGWIPFKGSAVLDVATGAFLELALTLG